jgi:hypothetical protein
MAADGIAGRTAAEVLALGFWEPYAANQPNEPGA